MVKYRCAFRLSVGARALLARLSMFMLIAASASVAFAGSGSVNAAGMSMGLFGGLALFLFGMEQMTDALKGVAGEGMKGVLARLTSNRFTGALTGALVTAVIQSSSVTSVLVVGFVSAGLMSLGQSIGVIMGANIGTTVTAQIVAFKVTKVALLFVAVGFALLFFTRRERWRQYGGVIMGLGLVFYGMNVMSDAMAPLRSYDPFIHFMVAMEHPLIGIVLGGLFTALVQSSSATTGLVIVMASQGFITLPAGIALALGANIGTCVTAVLAAIGKPRNALRAASVHVIFNVLGVVIWIGFIDHLADLAVWISPLRPELEGLARLGAETPRQIANANTLFNLANTLLFIGFTTPLASLVQTLFPDLPEPAPREVICPKYLDDDLIDTPSMALTLVRHELGRLGGHIEQMLAKARRALQEGDLPGLKEVEIMDDDVDVLHAAITAYLSRIAKGALTTEENGEFFQLTHAADNLEGVGDVIETDLVSVGEKMIRNNLQPSAMMWRLLNELHDDVAAALHGAIRAVAENDYAAAQEVIAMRRQIYVRVEAAFRRQTESLAYSTETRLATLRAEFEITDKTKRIYTLCKRIARLVVPLEPGVKDD